MKNGNNTPWIKRSSAEWTAATKSRPKRPKTQQSAGKAMASVFWDAHGILFIDYLEKGKTINSDYYMGLLDWLSAEIKKEQPHIFMVRIVNNIARTAICFFVSATHFLRGQIEWISFELLPHPPYSLYLAPSDYWLFADLQKCSRERDLASMKKWLPKLRPILTANTNHSTKKASKS